jgi:hypothetical protein
MEMSLFLLWVIRQGLGGRLSEHRAAAQRPGLFQVADWPAITQDPLLLLLYGD